MPARSHLQSMLSSYSPSWYPLLYSLERRFFIAAGSLVSSIRPHVSQFPATVGVFMHLCHTFLIAPIPPRVQPFANIGALRIVSESISWSE